MAATGTGYGLIQAGINLGALFDSLGSGATAESPAVTFPFATNATASTPFWGDLTLAFASTAMGAGTPNIQGVWIVSDDGTNYELWGVSNSQLFPYNTPYFFQVNVLPTVAYTLIRAPAIQIPPVLSTGTANPKLVLFNNLGVALPATVTATLYPFGGSIG